MAKYLLNENTALRSWTDAPYAIYNRSSRTAVKIPAQDYLFLVKCDGMTDIPEDDKTEAGRAEALLKHGIIKRLSGNGEDAGLSDWQLPRFYPNEMFYDSVVEITERCNYNCLHCFNAADLEISRNELKLEQIRRYFKELSEVGVEAVLLTGGEPMLHPDFPEILKAAVDAGIDVEGINTNGYFLTQEIFDKMKELGVNPVLRISFDGIGCHDWMRQAPGAEEKALSSIRLSVENGFKVWVQMNANRKNKDSITESLKLLDGMGVWKVRIIRTTEAPRWIKTAGDACMTWEEYFDFALTVLEEYVKKDRKMHLEFWQFIRLNPKKKVYQLPAVRFWEGEDHSSEYLCRGNIYIGADGYLYPCLMMSGAFKEKGIIPGDLEKKPLRDCLKEGVYAYCVNKKVSDKRDGNERCHDCPFHENCGGGCPAISMIYHGQYCGPCDCNCIFFRDGYYEKIKAVLPGYSPTIPMNSEKDASYLKNCDFSVGKLLNMTADDFTGPGQ